MLSKLNMLGTEMLQAMQSRIGEILASRLDTRIIRGRTATFQYNGILHTVRIEKINTKTVSCVEILPSPGKQWRIGANSLKVSPIERSVAAPLREITVPHKPASVATDAW